MPVCPVKILGGQFYLGRAFFLDTFGEVYWVLDIYGRDWDLWSWISDRWFLAL